MQSVDDKISIDTQGIAIDTLVDKLIITRRRSCLAYELKDIDEQLEMNRRSLKRFVNSSRTCFCLCGPRTGSTLNLILVTFGIKLWLCALVWLFFLLQANTNLEDRQLSTLVGAWICILFSIYKLGTRQMIPSPYRSHHMLGELLPSLRIHCETLDNNLLCSSIFRSSKNEIIRHHHANQLFVMIRKEIVRVRDSLPKQHLPPVTMVYDELKTWAQTTEAILVNDQNLAIDELVAMCEVADLIHMFFRLQSKCNFPMFQVNLTDCSKQMPIAQALLQKRIAKQWVHEELMCFCFNICNQNTSEVNIDDQK